jgi:hypothetical protein
MGGLERGDWVAWLLIGFACFFPVGMHLFLWRQTGSRRNRYEDWLPWQQTIVVQNDQDEFNRRLNRVLLEVDRAGGVLEKPTVVTFPVPLDRDSLTGQVTAMFVLQGHVRALFPPASPYPIAYEAGVRPLPDEL